MNPLACSALRRSVMRGQALAEGVVALGALATLFWAIPVLGRYLDMALSATQASRHAAFRATRDEAVATHPNDALSGFDRDWTAWRDDRGAALVTGAPVLRLRRAVAVPELQPGGTGPAAGLYADWRLDDQGVLTASIALRARDVVSGRSAGPDGLVFQGHTAILSGTGHATDDADVGRRIVAGELGWGRAQALSGSAGRAVAARMSGTERGWGRPAPTFDWLSAWSALVPADRIVSRDQP